MGGDDYVIDGDLTFSNRRDALEFYQEEYHKKKEWVGMTDEEISDIQQQFYKLVTFYDKDFARAIEAKLKEKNT